jgi:hypothetical protein
MRLPIARADRCAMRKPQVIDGARRDPDLLGDLLPDLVVVSSDREAAENWRAWSDQAARSRPSRSRH